MLKSRVVLALAVLAGSLSITGAAQAGSWSDFWTMGTAASPHTDLYSMPTYPSYVSCHKVKRMTANGRYVKNWVCGMRTAKFVCSKYMVTVTPIHRDRYCSEWTMMPSKYYSKGRYPRSMYVYR